MATPKTARAPRAPKSKEEPGSSVAESDLEADAAAGVLEPGRSFYDYRSGVELKIERLSVGPRTDSRLRDDLGFCGQVPDGPNIERLIESQWGGGTYTVRSPNRPPTTITVRGASRAIDGHELDEGDDDWGAEPLPGRHLAPQGYPQGYHPPQFPGYPPSPSPLEMLQRQQMAGSSSRDREEALEWKTKATTLQDRVESLQLELAKALSSLDRATDLRERDEATHRQEIARIEDRAKSDQVLAELRARLDSRHSGPDPQLELMKHTLKAQSQSENMMREILLKNANQDPLRMAEVLSKLTKGKEVDHIGQMGALLSFMNQLKSQGGGDSDDFNIKDAIAAVASGISQGAAGGAQASPGAPAQATHSPTAQAAPVSETSQRDSLIASLRSYADVLGEALRQAGLGTSGAEAAGLVSGYAAGKYGADFQSDFCATCATGTVDESLAELRGKLAQVVPILPGEKNLSAMQNFLANTAGDAWMRELLAVFKVAPHSLPGSQ